jgi:hypothetical protein
MNLPIEDGPPRTCASCFEKKFHRRRLTFGMISGRVKGPDMSGAPPTAWQFIF